MAAQSARLVDDMALSLNVAVIGAGNIGGTLGRAFARAGHKVTFGVRDPAATGAAAVAADSGAEVATVAQALVGAEVVVLALPGNVVEPFLREHAAALESLLIVDATNRIGGPGPAHSHDSVLAAVPTARYARAFNSVGWENFAEPRFGETVADLFFSAGEEDRLLVEALISAVGLRPVYVGVGQHDVVDGVLRLWFALAVGQGRGRRLAFRVLDASDG
jgi:8-hydroxy-5-deazaflavin:NADPH oxidoreductase